MVLLNDFRPWAHFKGAESKIGTTVAGNNLTLLKEALLQM